MKMKSTFRTLVSAIFVSALSTAAYAVELQEATNRQLLDELAYRLNTSGGGNSSSIVSYSCDGSANFEMSVVGPNGNETTRVQPLQSSTSCRDQIALLTANRSRIVQTTIVAVCNGSATLFRYSITPEGVVTNLSPTAIGSTTRCRERAQAINTSAT